MITIIIRYDRFWRLKRVLFTFEKINSSYRSGVPNDNNLLCVTLKWRINHRVTARKKKYGNSCFESFLIAFRCKIPLYIYADKESCSNKYFIFFFFGTVCRTVRNEREILVIFHGIPSMAKNILSCLEVNETR